MPTCPKGEKRRDPGCTGAAFFFWVSRLGRRLVFLS